jgi:hypothetical protein
MRVLIDAGTSFPHLDPRSFLASATPGWKWSCKAEHPDLPSRSELVPYVLSLATALRKTDTVDVYNAPIIDLSGAESGDGAEDDVRKVREEQEERAWLEKCAEYDLIWRIEDKGLALRSASVADGREGEGDKVEGRKRRKCGNVPVLK